MTTMADILDRPDVSLLFFVRFSGIPYLFSNAPLPAAWQATSTTTTTFFSDTYTWSQTLVLGNQFGKITTKAEPKAGLGTVGGLDFEHILSGTDDPSSDVWLDLLIRYPQRTDRYVATQSSDFDADDTTAFAAVTTGWPASGDFYAGLETMDYASHDGTKFISIERAKYGSWPMDHRVTPSNDEVLPFGTLVSDWPLAWSGRRAELYACAGRTVDGVFEPLSGPVYQQIYQGWVKDLSEGGDGLSVTVKTSGLDGLLDREVGTRLPTAKPIDLFESGKLIHVGPHNWWLSWALNPSTDTNSSTASEVINEARLQNSTGTGDAVEGIYNLRDLEKMITNTFNTSGALTTFSNTYLITYEDEGNTRIELATATPTGASALYQLTLFIKSPTHTTLIRDLGYTGDINVNGVNNGTIRQYEFGPAPETPPLFRWPSRRPKPGKIYYDLPLGPDFDGTPGWTSDAGNATNGYVFVGEHDIVKITGTGTVAKDGKTYSYMTVGNTNELGALPPEDLIVTREQGESDRPNLVQALVFIKTNLQRALLYYVVGGSGVAGELDATYDQGWSGSGLALPTDVIDVAGIADLGVSTQRDWWVVREPMKLRDILASELVIHQLMLVPQADFNTGDGFKLRLIDASTPLECVAGQALTLDHTIARTIGNGAGYVLDRSDDKIINRVIIKSDFDHLTGKYQAEFRQGHLTSIMTFGENSPLKLDVRTMRRLGEQNAVLVRAAESVWSRYAMPYEYVEIDAAHAKTWGWQVGDEISITLDQLPDLYSVGRGWTTVRGKVYVKTDTFLGGQISSRLTIVTNAALGRRYSGWAPAAQLNSTSDGGSTWAVEDHTYTESTDATDLSFFSNGDRVYVSRRGDPTTTVIRTVDTVDTVAGTISFTAAVTGVGSGGDVDVWFAQYSNASTQADQRIFSAFSGTDGDLDVLGRAGDAPYYYL